MIPCRTTEWTPSAPTSKSYLFMQKLLSQTVGASVWFSACEEKVTERLLRSTPVQRWLKLMFRRFDPPCLEREERKVWRRTQTGYLCAPNPQLGPPFSLQALISLLENVKPGYDCFTKPLEKSLDSSFRFTALETLHGQGSLALSQRLICT
jgi:hypothetical protein